MKAATGIWVQWVWGRERERFLGGREGVLGNQGLVKVGHWEKKGLGKGERDFGVRAFREKEAENWNPRKF